MSYRTEQEEFWAGKFGTEYIGRNDSAQLLASNLHLFSNAFKQAGAISSCLELGANIGMNLQAIRLLYPGMNLNAVEINQDAVKKLSELIGESNVFHGSIFEYPVKKQVDLAMIKGVLIHINPELLKTVYEKLYAASSRFIFIC